MALFDPFGDGKREEDVSMPTFGSFETNSKSNAFDPFGTEKVKDTEMPTFGSFETTKKTSFDPFGTEPERDTEMPTFGSFETSKKESFDPFGTETKRDTEMPTFQSFGPEKSATETSPEVKQTLNSNTPVKSNLDQGTAKRNDASSEVGHNVTASMTTSSETKQRQNERTSLSESLASVRTLLKPIQCGPTTLNFDPNLAKVDIPPPVKFSKTPLAQELVTFCQQALKHTFVFQT